MPMCQLPKIVPLVLWANTTAANDNVAAGTANRAKSTAGKSGLKLARSTPLLICYRAVRRLLDRLARVFD